MLRESVCEKEEEKLGAGEVRDGGTGDRNGG